MLQFFLIWAILLSVLVVMLDSVAAISRIHDIVILSFKSVSHPVQWVQIALRINIRIFMEKMA